MIQIGKQIWSGNFSILYDPINDIGDIQDFDKLKNNAWALNNRFWPFYMILQKKKWKKL